MIIMTEFNKPNAERRQELSVEKKCREFFILQSYTFILTRLYRILVYIYERNAIFRISSKVC